MKTKEQTFHWLMSYCRHYDTTKGLPRCVLGVDFSQFAAKGGLPCYRDSHPTPCERKEPPDPAQTRRKAEELEEAHNLALTRLSYGLCPHCGGEVKTRRVVGRCAYAEPCGHRIGQI